MTGTGYSLTQSMKLGQTMAPQMRQSLKMLQMTSLELRAELQQQMEQNPVIEDVRSPLERQMSSALPEEHAGAAVTERELDFTPGGEAAQATLATDDGYRDYFLGNMESASGDEEAQSRRQHLFDSLTRSESLQEHLKAQVPLSDIPPEDRELAVMLISHVDDDGYFRGSIPDIQMVTGKSEQHILGVLSAIHEFDPLGCGARDLRECLLAQMEKLDDSPWENEVRALIDRHLPDVAARREGFLCQELGITPEEYGKVLAELRTLNPKPGFAIRPPNMEKSVDVDRERDYVRPEVFAVPDGNGGWRAAVPERDLPEIHISEKYLKMLSDPACNAETKAYIRERIRAAEALREAVANRQDTIRGIAQAIIDKQPEVFAQGTMNALRPLTMQQVADVVGVHGTTVSRTVRNKYIRTPFGTVELRKFFTGGLATESGEAVSNTSVQQQIRELIAAEDAASPLSDDRIAALLKAKGISIARRTVAKYRIELGIPGAIERRLKA